MKKIILSLLMLGTAQAESMWVKEIANANQTIKSTRIRLQDREGNGGPRSFFHEVETISNLLRCQTIGSRHADDSERVTVLEALFQGAVLESHFPTLRLPDFSFENLNNDKTQHFAVLSLMKEGVKRLHDHPLIGCSFDGFATYLINHLRFSHPLMNNLLNMNALRLIFPSAFFSSFTTYAYNFKDYKHAQELKVTLAFQGVCLSKQSGFNLPQGVTRYLTVEEERPDSVLVIVEKEKGQAIDRLFLQYSYTPEVQWVFPCPFMGEYRILGAPGQDGKGPTLWRPEEIIARLLALYKRDEEIYIDYFILNDAVGYEDPSLIPLYLGKTRQPNAFLLAEFLGLWDIDMHGIIEAFECLPVSLFGQQDRIKTFLKALQDAGIKKFTPDMVNPLLLSLLKADTDTLEITGGGRRILFDHQKNARDALRKREYEAVDYQFKTGIIATHIPIPHNLEALAEKYQVFLNNPTYRSDDFLIEFCERKHDSRSEEGSQYENEIKAFSQILGQTENTLSPNLYEYLLTLAVLKNRQPEELGRQDLLKLHIPLPARNTIKKRLGVTAFKNIEKNLVPEIIEELGADLATWVNTTLAYMGFHRLNGTAYMDANEIGREAFCIRKEFPSYGQKPEIFKDPITGKSRYKKIDLIELGDCPTYSLVANYNIQHGFDPCNLALKMYVQWAVHKEFWNLQDNINEFTYDDENQEAFVNFLSCTEKFSTLSHEMLSLLVKVFIESNY